MKNPAAKNAIRTQDRKRAEALACAARGLGFETLETRRSDALDFREVAVWTVRDALRAAFDAGYEAGLTAAARNR